MALDSGTRLGPYEILAPLGSGGMGEVYRARDTRLDRVVAVKVLPAGASSAQALERFEREARTIAALNHPRICSIYDVGTAPSPYLVMELLDGETLHQRLTRGPVELGPLVDAGLALADALAAAHGKGIVHRDLKPANIFLTAHGPKILDFGLARMIGPISPDVGATAQPTAVTHGPLTDAGVTMGTVAYMSPEQLHGEGLDARTDLFSLGLVLYEMATGRRAFPGATSAAISAAILHEQPAAPRQIRPDLPARLEQAILTLLEKDRDVRTQTASELRAELTRLTREMSGSRAPETATPAAVAAAGAGVSATAPVRVAAPASGSSDALLIAGVVGRHRAVLVGAAALLAIALGAVYFVTRPASVGTGDNGSARLSIADVDVQQLTTSGTAATPAISPDGNYVAYVEQGTEGDSLRVRQVATGSNVEIVRAEPGVRLFAPAVTPDGTFVDYLKSLGAQPPELWQIPFLGGTPRHLLTGIASGVGFSADGRRMAYVRADATGQTEVVIAASDGSGAQVLATRRASDGRFLTVTGPGLGWFAPAWSPDGTTLAVLGARIAFDGQVVFIDTRTGSERTVDFGPPLPGITAAWLDEGTLLLSALDRSSAPLQLWLLSYPQGEFSRLTNDTSQYVGVNLTADRNELVTARSEGSFSIWTSDATASRWTQVVPTTPVKGPIGFGVRWLGDDLLYPSGASGGWALERWHASTRTTEILAPGGGAPQVSEDGSTIVFFNYDTGELWKMEADGRNRVLLDRGGANTRVTPDGRHLTVVDLTAGNRLAVRIRPLDGAGDARDVTADRVRPGGAAVSPDGQWIAYTAFDDQNRPAIGVCDLATCASTRTFPLVAANAWAPDSQGLAYVDPRTRSDIWIQPLDGSAPRQLTRFPPDGQQIWDFAWSANGQRLAVARASLTNNIVLFRGLRRPMR